MTSQEFNDKYKNYLEEGFSGLSFDIPEVTKFLDGCFDTLIKDRNFKYSQIKLKFNHARFYCTLSDFWRNTIEAEVNRLVKIYDMKKKAESLPPIEVESKS